MTAAVLGKRKARDASSNAQVDASELLRRHFEAQFLPLEQTGCTKPRDGGEDMVGHDGGEEKGEEEKDEEEEWNGLSEDNGGDDTDEDEDEDVSDRGSSGHINKNPTVQIVDHSKPQIPKETAMTKRELKAFMSSRPPDQTSRPTTATATTTQSEPSKSTSLPEDAPSLLKQDLELRRLIAESHLLAPHAATKSLSSVSVNAAQPKSFAEGRTRHKATDLRVQALGSKLSIHKQEKMPMHIRKGIAAAADARETKRRREAKENGIILERETGKKRRERGRDGGLDRPGVGRFKGAELRISERDVRGIEGTRDTFGRKGRR
ncbi:pre-rRNA processing and 40S ribosomal subunit assembly [Conoideocrella luteorostrata]|uniref:Pre-rRNA processing and 40S ribosomal subunit assembly n=1 Tax=Conoideocrella luteorostrata TaxID=1105319 RepID=A0AAJ0CFX2_9HYPO|nr:pre-rRNA processing and 40S ribosomal subunit assembly [Conoideocrella luteorostrata]